MVSKNELVIDNYLLLSNEIKDVDYLRVQILSESSIFKRSHSLIQDCVSELTAGLIPKSEMSLELQDLQIRDERLFERYVTEVSAEIDDFRFMIDKL